MFNRHSLPASSTRSSRPTGRARRDRVVRLGVPKCIGAGGIAILGGAFAGIVIAVLFQPPVAAAPAAGAVTITSEPAGLPLRVDGTARGVTPLATMLVVGAHVVELGSGDRVRQHRLLVRAGTEASLHVDWLPEAATAAVAAPPQSPARAAPESVLAIDRASPLRLLVDRRAAAGRP